MSYELSKKKLERHKVMGALMEKELKIQERQAEIKRLEDDIEISQKRINELDKDIKKLE